jgi:Bardet-Biedl syndrome 1 protein
MLLGMANGEVRLYHEKHLVAQLRINEPVTALRFGSYGREEGCLAIVGASGSLSIKILQRTAKFDTTSSTAGPPPEQDVPLSIPKKTKLYVEQTQREREQATEMHRAFQRDLCKLRLSTARAYVKMITDGQGPMSYSSGSALRLTAQVQGLGPRFKIKLSLQNTGTKAVSDLSLALNYNALNYRVKTAVFDVPTLVPGLVHRLDAELECIDENGAPDVVRVYVCPLQSLVPILSALVNMPASEMLLSNTIN